MKFYILILFFLYSMNTLGQIKKIPLGEKAKGIEQIGANKKINKDSLRNAIPKLPAKEYKIFRVEKDTISVDTTLNIRNAYSFNQFFKDDFNVLAFSNIGQPATQLDYQVQLTDILPGFIANAKLTDYWNHHQIPFFKTPTPYSDLSYLNGIKQGQILNALFATNVLPRLNLAAGYRGLRSLGLYKHSVSSSGRFFTSLNYESKNQTYKLKAYYYTYEKTNEENGGIADINQFENGGQDFNDRSRIDVILSDAENQLKKRRLFLSNEYGILDNKFRLINQNFYEDNRYEYTQNKPHDKLGESTQTKGKIKDSVRLKRYQFFNGLGFSIKQFKLQSGIRYIYQEYAFDSLKEMNGQTFPQNLVYKDLSWDSKLKVALGKLQIKGKLNIGITKNLAGYLLTGSASYPIANKYKLKAGIVSSSKKPDFKYILYQSAYDKYNWYQKDLKNEWTQKLTAELSHKKYGKLSLSQIIINNYTYFDKDSLPKQNATGIKYTALHYRQDFHYKKLGLSTDISLQKVLDGQDLLDLPAYIIRGTFYFSDYYYQRNLFIQTGITAKYFEAFYARAYNPVLSEFILQDQQKIGGYPILDYFIDFKVKRFRFYFKLSHINALWEPEPTKYYAAPLQPYSDFSIRFGLRWIFFN